MGQQQANRPESQKLAYKFFWTWDHSTNWILNAHGAQNTGVGNNYLKSSEMFVNDYKQAIKWCEANGIDAIGIVGMLRDAHGGFDNARRVCAYAREHGVRVYLIAGLYAYGGIYYEGDSPLSLDRFLENNPDCIGKGLDMTPQYIQFCAPHGCRRQPNGCPSSKKLRNFILDSLYYLFAALPELGGIQMEAGDSAVCMCEECRARRELMQGGEARVPFKSFSDMADIYPEAADVIWSRSPDAWVICETYSHFSDNKVFGDTASPALQAMLKMPEKTFWQWSDRHINWNDWKESDRLPEPLRKFRHIMRAHHGTQWTDGRHNLAVEEIRLQCRLTFASGMQAVSMFGESSPFHTNNEFNYLALQYFADAPHAETSAFAKDIMAPRLGGIELAERYLEFAALGKAPDKLPNALRAIAQIAGGLEDCEQIRRWTWLASFLNAIGWNHRIQS